MSIYKFRVLVEADEVIFKDIEVKSNQTFEDFHEMIVAAFGFDNSQMASFYTSNDQWEKGQEIALFDMNMDDEQAKILVMAETPINTQINCIGAHLLYSYDFLNMTNFFIELIEIIVKETAEFYPRVVHSQGEFIPSISEDSALSEEEMANQLLKNAGFDEEGDDGDDMFEGFDDFDNFENYDESGNY
ncbi:MAG: hypothetical protein H6587_09650 [Flavobacteriales bacterium]|nr:hypothetical protein [Flavobacteriales bacterium]